MGASGSSSGPVGDWDHVVRSEPAMAAAIIEEVQHGHIRAAQETLRSKGGFSWKRAAQIVAVLLAALLGIVCGTGFLIAGLPDPAPRTPAQELDAHALRVKAVQFSDGVLARLTQDTVPRDVLSSLRHWAPAAAQQIEVVNGFLLEAITHRHSRWLPPDMVSAGMATDAGIPESPLQLLDRLARFRGKDLHGPEAQDLAEAVVFWNQYWLEKYQFVLRHQYHRARQNLKQSGLKSMNQQHKQFLEAEEAIRAHLVFYENLKEVIRGGPLEALLPAFSSPAQERQVAALQQHTLPARARYLDPHFPKVVTATSGDGRGMQSRHVARVTEVSEAAGTPKLSQSSSPGLQLLAPIHGPSLQTLLGTHVEHPFAHSSHNKALLCGEGRLYCTSDPLAGPVPGDDAKKGLIQAVWDYREYARSDFQKLALLHVLAPMHEGPHKPVVYVAFGNVYASKRMGAPFKVQHTARRDMAAAIRSAIHKYGTPETVRKVVLTTALIPGGGQSNHAGLVVLDVPSHRAQYLDPWGLLAGDLSPLANTFFRAFFEHEDTVRAIGRYDFVVDPSETVDLAFRHHWGPQVLQNSGSNLVLKGHDGTCVLWSLWLAHAIGAYTPALTSASYASGAEEDPTLSTARLLNKAITAIMETEDLDPVTIAELQRHKLLRNTQVKTHESLYAHAGKVSNTTVTPGAIESAAIAFERFVYRFGSQLMSLIPTEDLQAYARAQGIPWEPRGAPDPAMAHPTTPVTPEVLQRMEDASKLLKKVDRWRAVKRGQRVEPTLHRLRRLRRMLRASDEDRMRQGVFEAFGAARREDVQNTPKRVAEFLKRTNFFVGTRLGLYPEEPDDSDSSPSHTWEFVRSGTVGSF